MNRSDLYTPDPQLRDKMAGPIQLTLGRGRRLGVGGRRLRVLLISHTCQSRTEGQPKAHLLGQMPGIELMVVVPERWKHYGTWRQPDPPLSDTFVYRPERVRFPWAGPGQFYLHHYPDLGKILRTFRPDVIDLWEEPWSAVSAQACWLRRKICPEARVISETEQNINKRLPPPFEMFRRYTLAEADFAVCRNTESVTVLRSKGYRGPVEVVGNGVDADLFRPMDKTDCRSQFLPDWADSSLFVVGYVGRMVEEKGLLDLVAAVARCPNEVRLALVGDGPLRDELNDRIQKLGLSDRARLLRAKPLTELPGLMNAFDVLALPSRTTARWKEQFGRVIIEAHACGVPVIGSDSGAIPEVIGEGGVVVPEADANSLATAIKALNLDRTAASRMGRSGLSQVKADYTWDQIAARMHSVYQRVMVSLTGRARGADNGAMSGISTIGR